MSNKTELTLEGKIAILGKELEELTKERSEMIAAWDKLENCQQFSIYREHMDEFIFVNNKKIIIDEEVSDEVRKILRKHLMEKITALGIKQKDIVENFYSNNLQKGE